jgi:hypothetical protein
MRALVAAVLALVAAAPVRADGDLRRLFPTEADVFVTPGAPLSRLVLPPEVLAAVRPDLSDLRLFAAEGRELPFAVDAGTPAVPHLVPRVEPAKVLDARREETRPEDGPPVQRESYDVAAPETASPAGWELVLSTPQARFVRRVTVTAHDAAGATRTLLDGGSVFRLPNAPRDKTALPLAVQPGDRVTVVLEGEDGAYLEPRLEWRTTAAIADTERAVLPLASLSSESSGGETTVELARPTGLLPDRLRLETSTGTFDRAVEVWDVRNGRDAVQVGGGRVFRLGAAVPVEERELALSRPQGDRLRLVIADGDSPPLDDLRIDAVVRQPALVFTLFATSPDVPAGTLRYGGGRAYPPRYDVASLAASGGPLYSAREKAAERLRDRDAMSPARLGTPHPNPDFDGAPALAFAMRPGAAIDTRVFERRRPFQVTPSPEGLSRLQLGPEDVTGLRPDLGDLRVVDRDGHQWPYLLDRDATPTTVPVRIGPPVVREGMVRYALDLPATGLRVGRVALATDEPFFDRSFTMTGWLDGKPVRLVSGRLTRVPARPRPLAIEFSPTRVDRLELAVAQTDDAPLEFRSATARAILPALFLVAPEGRYALVGGAPDVAPPRYELERARDVVLSVTAAPAEPGIAGVNPEYSKRARLASEATAGRVLPRIVLWVVLLGAAVVLTAVTLRAAKREEPPAGSA